MDKVKCYSVRLESLISISEKAYKAISFDGSSAIIPKSQVFGQDHDVKKSTAFWISEWILNQKNLQFSNKKVSYFDKEKADYTDPWIEIKRHIPSEKECVQVEPIAELIKENALLNKMKTSFSEGKTKVLTLELAAELKGKRIQTIYFGYDGQNGVDDFIVGDVVSEYHLAEMNVDEKNFPQGNQAKYWESYMSLKKISALKKEMHILTFEGRKTFIRTTAFTNKFHCSDSERIVQFIEA